MCEEGGCAILQGPIDCVSLALFHLFLPRAAPKIILFTPGSLRKLMIRLFSVYHALQVSLSAEESREMWSFSWTCLLPATAPPPLHYLCPIRCKMELSSYISLRSVIVYQYPSLCFDTVCILCNFNKNQLIEKKWQSGA